MTWRTILLVVGGAAVIIALVLLVREVRRAPPGTRAPTGGRSTTDPLTDVARRSSPVPEVQPAPLPPVVNREGQLEAPPPRYVPPADMPDPATPPQGTAPLAAPGAPQPPDPFVEPEIKQDPNRGGRNQ